MICKNKLRIIYYHTISNSELEFFPKKTTQSINTFKKQISYLNRRYNIISLDEAFHKFQNNESFNNDLVITTDDGFKENYTVIAPVLNEFGVPFSAFLCNDLIDNKLLMWRNILFLISKKGPVKKSTIRDLCEEFDLNMPQDDEIILSWSLREWDYMNKDSIAQKLWDLESDLSLQAYLDENSPYLNTYQVKELIKSGVIIGSHSKSHPNFNTLSNKEIIAESVDSANDLENKFNIPVRYFSFPFERADYSSLNNDLQTIIEGRFDIILGIHDRLLNHQNNPKQWDRVSMEYNYPVSISKFYLTPLKRNVLKFLK